MLSGGFGELRLKMAALRQKCPSVRVYALLDEILFLQARRIPLRPAPGLTALGPEAEDGCAAPFVPWLIDAQQTPGFALDDLLQLDLRHQALVWLYTVQPPQDLQQGLRQTFHSPFAVAAARAGFAGAVHSLLAQDGWIHCEPLRGLMKLGVPALLDDDRPPFPVTGRRRHAAQTRLRG